MDMQVSESTALAIIPDRPLVATEVFAQGGVDAVLASIAAKARAHKPDISTEAGRQKVASIAYQVARSKTALDDMGKGLVAGWKTAAAAVDADRRRIREFLDALRDEVRAPLTAFEQAEESRIARHEQALASISEAPGFYSMAHPSGTLRALLVRLQAYDTSGFEEFTARAQHALASEVALAKGALAAAEKREAEAAELERLRAEADARRQQDAERERQEREARIAAEAAERARQAAEQKAAAESRAAEERAAAALREAEQKAERERFAAERAAQEKAAAEERAARAERDAEDAARRAAAERVAAAERAERERVEAVEAERRRAAAAEKAQRDADERRAADKAHRGAINRAAYDALLKLGLTDEHARSVIAAIVRGGIPHTSIRY